MDEFIGKKFGRLTVIEALPRERDAGGVLKKEMWLCSCECGNSHTSQKNHLVSGGTTSCGCLKKELRTTHGMSYDPLYQTWLGLRTRILTSSHKFFKHYGGRGLKMESEWVDNFPAFREWVLGNLGPKPSPEFSLDRVKNHLGYLKGNLRWATQSEQHNNCRTNRVLTFQGITATLKQHCDRLGLKYGTMRARLSEHGWTVDEALSTPTDGKYHRRPNTEPVEEPTTDPAEELLAA